MEKIQVTRYVGMTREKFLTLNGNGTEVVRISEPDCGSRAYNGDYLFLRMPEGANTFVRQVSINSPSIDVLLCNTEHFHFPNSASGMVPKHIYYEVKSIGPNDGEGYSLFREKLEMAGEWKNFRERRVFTN